MTVVGVFLVRAHDDDRAQLVEAFARRSALAARLTTGALQGDRESNAEFALGKFGGATPAVRRALRTDDDGSVAILDSDDMPIAQTAAAAGAMGHEPWARHPEVRVAHRGLAGYSDIMGSGAQASIVFATRFRAGDGSPRYWLALAPAEQVQQFVAAFLASALAVPAGRAYLIDGSRRIVATTRNEVIGTTLPDLGGADARSTPRRVGNDLVVSATIPGTSWRVVFQAPYERIVSPLAAANRQAWLLFGGLCAMLLLLVAFGASAVRQSSRLAYERQHDSLTGLPTRALFAELVTAAFAQLRHPHGGAAALFIDLDSFKSVNDRFGHAVGDQLLTAVASRLTACLRPNDLISRFGGDEFVVVLCDHGVPADTAREVARRMQRSLSRPFEIDARQLTIECSIGVAYYDRTSDDDRDVDALLRRADCAMYMAKRTGGGAISVDEHAVPIAVS